MALTAADRLASHGGIGGAQLLGQAHGFHKRRHCRLASKFPNLFPISVETAVGLRTYRWAIVVALPAIDSWQAIVAVCKNYSRNCNTQAY